MEREKIEYSLNKFWHLLRWAEWISYLAYGCGLLFLGLVFIWSLTFLQHYAFLVQILSLGGMFVLLLLYVVLCLKLPCFLYSDAIERQLGYYVRLRCMLDTPLILYAVNKGWTLKKILKILAILVLIAIIIVVPRFLGLVIWIGVVSMVWRRMRNRVWFWGDIVMLLLGMIAIIGYAQHTILPHLPNIIHLPSALRSPPFDKDVVLWSFLPASLYVFLFSLLDRWWVQKKGLDVLHPRPLPDTFLQRAIRAAQKFDIPENIQPAVLALVWVNACSPAFLQWLLNSPVSTEEIVQNGYAQKRVMNHRGKRIEVLVPTPLVRNRLYMAIRRGK